MRRVSLSVEGIGTCCSATSLGSSGGGRDWVPDIVNRYQPGLQYCVEQLILDGELIGCAFGCGRGGREGQSFMESSRRKK